MATTKRTTRETKTAPTTNPPADPRKVEILAAFDTAASSPVRDESTVSGFVDSVVGFAWTGWSEAAMRTVLRAYLDAAPSDDLDAMVLAARRELDWLADFALQCEYEDATGESGHGPAFEAWKAARTAPKAVRS